MITDNSQLCGLEYILEQRNLNYQADVESATDLW